MRIGGFPGQQAALKRRLEEVKREAWEQASRRKFLGIAAGSVAGLAAGSATTSLAMQGVMSRAVDGGGDAAADREPDESAPVELTGQLVWAEGVARGPLEKLYGARGTFLGALEVADRIDDPTLWFGVGRLAHVAIEAGDADGQTLRTHLLALARVHRPPPSLQPWFDAVTAVQNGEPR